MAGPRDEATLRRVRRTFIRRHVHDTRRLVVTLREGPRTLAARRSREQAPRRRRLGVDVDKGDRRFGDDRARAEAATGAAMRQDRQGQERHPRGRRGDRVHRRLARVHQPHEGPRDEQGTHHRQVVPPLHRRIRGGRREASGTGGRHRIRAHGGERQQR